MEGLTRSGFDRIADRDGLVVVYPDAIGHGWNDGGSDLRSTAVKERVDDIRFLRALPGLLAPRSSTGSARAVFWGATTLSN
jgi:polyhydroxybutyrate depolymerase